MTGRGAGYLVELITPSRVERLEGVRRLELPGVEGGLAVMAGHIPEVVELAAGEIVAVSGEGVRRAWRAGRGIALILGTRARVLVRDAEASQARPPAGLA